MVQVKKLNSIQDISQINGKGCYFENLTLSIDISKRAVKAPICPSKVRIQFEHKTTLYPGKTLNPTNRKQP